MTELRPRIQWAAGTPTAHQRLQIASLAAVHPRTVDRCYRSLPVRSTIAARVLAAAAQLHLSEPQIVIAHPELPDERGQCGERNPCLLLHMQSAPFACCFRCYVQRLFHMLEVSKSDG